MNIAWHLRKDTQTCEWSFQLTEGSFHVVMSLQEFFTMVKALNTTCLAISQKMIGDMSVADAITEVDKLLKGSPPPAGKDRYLRTVKGDVLGELDKDYELTAGKVIFDEVLLKGPWPPPSNEVMYGQVRLRVESVGSFTGLLVDEKGPRGPVIKQLVCSTLD